MTAVFLFSYLHSHLGQNSCSFPLILSAHFGRMTESQLLQDDNNKKFSRINVQNLEFLPFWCNNVVDDQNSVVVFLCVVHYRVDTRANAFASFVFVALSLKQKRRQIAFVWSFLRKISSTHIQMRCKLHENKHRHTNYPNKHFNLCILRWI